MDIPKSGTCKIGNSLILQNGVDLGEYNKICSWLERAVKTVEKQSKLHNITNFCAGVITRDASYAVIVTSQNNQSGFFAVHLVDGATSPIIDAKMIKDGGIRLSETLSMRLENAAIMKEKGVDISPPIPKACVDAYVAMQKTNVSQLYREIVETKINASRISYKDIDSDISKDMKNEVLHQYNVQNVESNEHNLMENR